MEESLLKAAATNDVKLLRFCLENSISVNSTNMNGFTALHIASKSGNYDIARELVDTNADINARTQMGNTPIHIAALAGRLEIVDLLVKNNANVNAQTNRGFTPLYMAAQQNNIDIVKSLLAAGANPYLLAEDKFAPLAIASQQGHAELVDILLTHEQMLEGSEKLTKLHMAVKKENLDIIESLLLANHFVDELSDDGLSPLCTAINFRRHKAADLLISKGANVNISLTNDNRPIHFATKTGRYKFVELLVSSEADVNVTNKGGFSPLHFAAMGGHQEILELLLENGANPTSQTKTGLTPLHYSCMKNYDSCARLLIAAGADVEAKATNGLTSLHAAAHYGCDAIVKQLINRNADFNAKTLNGYTPLHIACSRSAFEVVCTLLCYNQVLIDEPNLDGLIPLHTAAFMGEYEILKLLVDNGADLTATNNHGMTVIHFSAAKGSVRILKYLMRLNCDVNTLAKNGETPLLLSVYSCNLEATQLLIEKGADCLIASTKQYNVHHMAAKHNMIDLMVLLHETVMKTQGVDGNLLKKTCKGFSPIHVASKYGNDLIVKYLLTIGDDVNKIAKRKLTPLLIATHYGNFDVVQVLLDFKADFKLAASNGFTAVHIAVLYDNFAIAELLLMVGASPDSLSKAGFAPLHISTSRRSVEGTALLIKYDAFHSPASSEGITPMHCCAKEDCVDCAELLYAEGASLNEQNNDGYTPLLVACYYCSLNMVLFLLRNGVSLDHQTKIGYTALHQAAQQGSTEIVSLLLNHGADPNILCYENQTALDIANLFDHPQVVELLSDCTSVETAGPISKDKRVYAQPMGVSDGIFIDSEDETSDGHTLRRFLRFPKLDNSSNLLNSNQPIIHSFDVASTTIPEDHNVKETKLDFADKHPELPRNAPLVSDSCIFTSSKQTTNHTFINLYDSIVRHSTKDSKSHILAFDGHANPYFYSNYYSFLKVDNNDLLRLYPSQKSNICYDSNGIPLVASHDFTLCYNSNKQLIAQSADSRTLCVYYGDDFDGKQVTKPSVGVRLRGDDYYAVEKDEQLFYDCDGFPIIEGDGILYSDSHRNLFYVDHKQNLVKPLYYMTYQLKKEPKDILTTFDHYGTPLLGMISESSFSMTRNTSDQSACYSEFFMLSKLGIPLFGDSVSSQLYFDDDENLVSVDKDGVSTPILITEKQTPIKITVSKIVEMTDDAVFINCHNYVNVQYNYYGFPILFADSRQEDVDYRPNGLIELNSKVLCTFNDKRPLVWPLAYADAIFDCMGVPLPSFDLSLYMKSVVITDEAVVLNCDFPTGNLVYLPNGFPFCNLCSRNMLTYGSDGLLYYEDGNTRRPVMSNSRQIQKLSVGVEFVDNSYVASEDEFFYDCFGVPLVDLKSSSLVLTVKEDGRVCVVDGNNVTVEFFLFDSSGRFVRRRSCLGSMLYNSWGRLVNLNEYDASLVHSDDSYQLQYSGQTGLIYDDRACPLVINGNVSLLKYNSSGQLLYDNLHVYCDDGKPVMHPGSTVVINDSSTSAYLVPRNNVNYSVDWHGVPITTAETLGSILLRNDDYTLDFTDGISSIPLYYDTQCCQVMRAHVMPEYRNLYYTSDGVKHEGDIPYAGIISESDGTYHMCEDESKVVFMPTGMPLTNLQSGKGDLLYYDDNQLVCYSTVSKRPSKVFTSCKTPFTDPRASVIESEETLYVKPCSRGTVLFDWNGMPLVDTGRVRPLSNGTFLSYSTCSNLPRVLVSYETDRPIVRQEEDKKSRLSKLGDDEVEWSNCVLVESPAIVKSNHVLVEYPSFDKSKHVMEDSLVSENFVDGLYPLPRNGININISGSSKQATCSLLRFRVSFVLDARPKVIENKKLKNMRIFAGVNSVIRPTFVNVNFLHPSAVDSPDLSDGEQFATKIIQFTATQDNFRRSLVIDIPVYTTDDSSRSLYVLYQSDAKWIPFNTNSELVEDIISSACSSNGDKDPSSSQNVLRLCVEFFPITLAVISRPKTNIFTVDCNPQTVSPDNKCFFMFPQNFVNKPTDIAIQVLDVSLEDVQSTLGKKVFVSPIIMIKPLNVVFHEHFKCQVPLIGYENKNKLFDYEHNAHLFTSSRKSTTWEDMTYSTDIVLQRDFNIAFTSSRSAKFWIMMSPERDETTISNKLNNLYKKTLSVDYMAMFFVYAARVSPTSFHLICACVTDAVDQSFLYFDKSGYQQVISTKHYNIPGYQQIFVSVSGGGCYMIKPLESCKIYFDPFFENLLGVYVEFFENSEGTPQITFLNEDKSRIFTKSFNYPSDTNTDKSVINSTEADSPLNGCYSTRDVKIITETIYEENLSDEVEGTALNDTHVDIVCVQSGNQSDSFDVDFVSFDDKVLPGDNIAESLVVTDSPTNVTPTVIQQDELEATQPLFTGVEESTMEVEAIIDGTEVEDLIIEQSVTHQETDEVEVFIENSVSQRANEGGEDDDQSSHATDDQFVIENFSSGEDVDETFGDSNSPVDSARVDDQLVVSGVSIPLIPTEDGGNSDPSHQNTPPVMSVISEVEIIVGDSEDDNSNENGLVDIAVYVNPLPYSEYIWLTTPCLLHFVRILEYTEYFEPFFDVYYFDS